MTGAPAQDAAPPRVYASLWARFVASLVDLVAITLPSLIIARVLKDAPYRLADLVVTIFVSAYFIVSYTQVGGGYSPGKAVAGIRVVDRDGRPLTVSAAAVRWFMSIGIALPLAFLAIGFERGMPVRTGPAMAVCVPILCIVIVDSYLTVANRVSHVSLHDLAAGSFVVRRAHSGPVPAAEPIGRANYAWMAAICIIVALGFARIYPWSRVIGQRSVELLKARELALASHKAASLIVAPAFAAQGSDTTWVISAIATIHAKPQTEFEAEALRKSLACALAREAPLAFRGAELDLLTTFDRDARPTRPTTVYIADMELTPEACTGK